MNAKSRRVERRDSVRKLVRGILGLCLGMLAFGVPSGTIAAHGMGLPAVEGPYTSQNVTLYLLTSSDTVDHAYLTLEEALRTGRAVVHENNSQTLWIENLSDTDLFIQSGDLLKSGQQDRVVENDMILGAHDSSHELHVLCVEHLRSTRRGDEPLETFSASREQAPLPHIRILANHEVTRKLLAPSLNGLTAPDPTQLQLLEDVSHAPRTLFEDDPVQVAVWKDVESVQHVLTERVRDSVTRNISPSSLQLALEHTAVEKNQRAMGEELDKLIQRSRTVSGVVYMIHGRIAGAELYASHDLFLRMWPKVSRRISTESLLASGPVAPAAERFEVERYLEMTDRGSTVWHQVNDRTRVSAMETPETYQFQCFDTQRGRAPLHRAYLQK